MSTARFVPLLRTRVVAAPTTSFQAIRSISATASYNKSAVDAGKDALKKADRNISDAAVKGINKGGKYYALYQPSPQWLYDANMLWQ
jgi:hypothetical protein